jgi:hypothetical protein
VNLNKRANGLSPAGQGFWSWLSGVVERRLAWSSVPQPVCILEATTVATMPENAGLLGEIVLSPGARALIAQPDLADALRSHVRAASGVGQRPVAFRGNNPICGVGWRLLSLHRTKGGSPFLLITEADQTRTSVLLPHEL